MTTIDTQAAVGRLMRFLAVEGITGQEAAIGRDVVAALKEAGVPASAIKFDKANAQIPMADGDGQPDRQAGAAEGRCATLHPCCS